MLKRTIKYTDFNDEEQEGVFYFNISKTQLIKLLGEEGMIGAMQRMMDTKDIKGILETFEQIIMMAYGERSDDGKYFTQTEELSQKFLSHAAYDALFTEFTTSDTSITDFLTAVMPKDFRDEIAKKLAEEAETRKTTEVEATTVAKV